MVLFRTNTTTRGGDGIRRLPQNASRYELLTLAGSSRYQNTTRMKLTISRLQWAQKRRQDKTMPRRGGRDRKYQTLRVALLRETLQGNRMHESLERGYSWTVNRIVESLTKIIPVPMGAARVGSCEMYL